MPESSATPIERALARLAAGESLTHAESADAFTSVMRGESSPEQLRALLLGLREKGETASEIAGAAAAMRSAMTPVELPGVQDLVDTCGTGGGAVSTINLSTGAAFIVAGAGVPVAKHGNRSFTSRSGSADVLEALGIAIALRPEQVHAVLRVANVAFLFAPAYHPAMRHAAPVRKELRVATIMNLLGPLANPARVSRQVVGVADPGRGPLLARALASLGTRHALVVHGDAGMDEVAPAGLTRVWEVKDGDISEWEIDPKALGHSADGLADLRGGDPHENARRLEQVLRGREHGVVREALVLNAAAALYVAGRGWTMAEAAERAAASIDGGSAWNAVERLRTATTAANGPG